MLKKGQANISSVLYGTKPVKAIIKGGKYLYQSIRKAIVSGVLPLTLERATGENLIDYTIHGSSGGVGDKTDNLADYTKAYPRTAGQTVVIDDVNKTVIWSGNYFFKVPIDEKAGTTLNFDCEGEYSYKWAVEYKDGTTHGNVMNGTSITLTKDASALLVYKSNVATTVNNMVFKNLMLNYGDVVKPYEPFGYRIPITSSNGAETITTNIYIDRQLYEGDKAYRINDLLPDIPTFKGDTILDSTANVKPSLEVEYMRN